MNPSISNGEAPIATRSAFSRPAALIGGAVGLVALTAIATTLALRAPTSKDAADGSAAPMPAQSLAAAVNPSTNSPAETPADGSASPPKPAPVASSDRTRSAAAPRTATNPAHVQHGTVQPAAGPLAASTCAACGKVEAVNAVQKKGDGTGLGAVGGAVVGGLVGSQLGGGSGKGALAVLGALGGGVAGNEVEKRARATTLYEVRVRMDDGSLRTITQGSAPAVGQKVTVEGSTLRTRSSTS